MVQDLNRKVKVRYVGTIPRVWINFPDTGGKDVVLNDKKLGELDITLKDWIAVKDSGNWQIIGAEPVIIELGVKKV